MNLNDKHNISPNNKKMTIIIVFFSLLFVFVVGYLFVLNSKISVLEKENEKLTQIEETINNTDFALKEDLPTKVSPLENDSNFINKKDAQKLIEEEIKKLETKITNKNYASNYQLNTKYTELFKKIEESSDGGSKTIINKTVGDTYESIKEKIRDDYFPIGSLYYSMDKNFDPNVAWGGTWVKISEGNFIEATEDDTKVGEHEDAGLPEIEGKAAWDIGGQGHTELTTAEGAFEKLPNVSATYPTASSSSNHSRGFSFKASRSNSIYGNSDTVQPNAYYAYIWRRES